MHIILESCKKPALTIAHLFHSQVKALLLYFMISPPIIMKDISFDPNLRPLKLSVDCVQNAQ
jgi:hypothetical protein